MTIVRLRGGEVRTSNSQTRIARNVYEDNRESTMSLHHLLPADHELPNVFSQDSKDKIEPQIANLRFDRDMVNNREEDSTKEGKDGSASSLSESEISSEIESLIEEISSNRRAESRPM